MSVPGQSGLEINVLEAAHRALLLDFRRPAGRRPAQGKGEHNPVRRFLEFLL